MESEIHIFDLDHTLVCQNLSFSFGKYLYQRGDISLSQALTVSFVYLMHQCGFIPVQSVHEQALKRIFHRFRLDEIEQRVKDYIDESLPSLFNLKVLERFEGAPETCILSSSPDFIVSYVAKKLGVSLFGASVYGVDKDRKISYISSVMEGSSKAKFLLKLPHKKKVFYTDHVNDLEVCEVASEVVVVNPSRTLRSRASQAGWEIIDESSFSSHRKHKKQ